MTTPKFDSSVTRTDRAENRAEDLAKREAAERRLEIDDRFYTHLLTVLSVSSGMVGVCLTAIGLIGIIKSLNPVEMIVDDVLAIGALLFMLAAALSFVGMRSRLSLTWRSYARVLDLIFCCGLLLVVVAIVLLTWVVF